MSIQGQFKRFYSSINLTKQQAKEAKTKYEGVCEWLHSRYYQGKYKGKKRRLTGSYGKQTNVSPPRDVDVLFVMPQPEFAQYRDNEGNGPSQLLSDIREIVAERYPDPEIKADRRVVVVKFADASHNVEVLPGWRNKDGTFRIPNSREEGTWETLDLRSQIKKIEDSNSSTRRTSKLIRLIKKWQEYKEASVKSREIEKAVLGFFGQGKKEERPYSVLVRDFFEYLSSKAKIDDSAKSSAQTAYNIAVKACQLESNGDIDGATDGWREIFGSNFPGST